MKLIRKGAALLLAFAMMLSFAACGGKSDGGDAGKENEYSYIAQYLPVDIGAEYINAACWNDGVIYMIAQIEDGEEEYTYDSGEVDENGAPVMVSETYPTYRNVLMAVNTDGSNAHELANYTEPVIPEGAMEGSAGVQKLMADPSGKLWVLENIDAYYFDVPDDFDETTDSYWNYDYTDKNSYRLRQLDAEGSEILVVDLAFLAEESQNDWYYVNTVEFDGEGNIYVVADDGLTVLDPTGAKLFNFELGQNEWINTVVRLADGTVAAQTYGNEGQDFKVIDIAAKGWGDSITVPTNAYYFYAGSGDYDLYCGSETSLYGVDTATGESTMLLTWLNLSIDNYNLSSVIPLEDGTIFCISNTYDYNTGESAMEFIDLVRVPTAELAEKTTLTYACLYLDYNIRSMILDFNKNSDKYLIQIKDYSQYNTEDDYSAGLTKLTTEILTGNIPDMMSTDSLPMSQYASKGLLEDLWPYIEADTELGGRDALVPSLFKALEVDGSLYQICSTFSVQTAYGLASVVGTEPGWTLDEMLAAYASLPQGATMFDFSYTKSQMLSMLCYMFMDNFVDWESGQCSFDSQQFIDLLRLTEYFPETFDWENFNYDTDYVESYAAVRAGQQLLATGNLYSIDSYYYNFGGPDISDLTFIGYPSGGQDNGAAFSVSGGIAMSSTCADKAGAWEFMRTMLTKEYQSQNSWSLPTNQNLLDEKFKDLTTPTYVTDENGDKVEEAKNYYWDYNTQEQTPVYAMDQETEAKFRSLIEDTTRVYSYDENIYTIISDEAAAYFAGQSTAEAIAKNIQSRVSLYVNEQK